MHLRLVDSPDPAPAAMNNPEGLDEALAALRETGLRLLYLVGVVQRREFANRDDVVGLETDVAVLTRACEHLLDIVESDPLVDYL
jgi:hypothetical protein